MNVIPGCKGEWSLGQCWGVAGVWGGSLYDNTLTQQKIDSFSTKILFLRIPNSISASFAAEILSKHGHL
jgi:hypothetical protein